MEERMDYRILSNGTMMPSLGFGAYKIGSSIRPPSTGLKKA